MTEPKYDDLCDFCCGPLVEAACRGCLNKETRRAEQVKAQRDRLAEALRDERIVLERLLQNVKHYETRYATGQWVNAYAAAEFPDWEIRQRLDAIGAALASLDGRGEKP